MASSVMSKYFVDELSVVLDENKKTTHEKLAAKVENVLDNDGFWKKIKNLGDVSAQLPSLGMHVTLTFPILPLLYRLTCRKQTGLTHLSFSLAASTTSAPLPSLLTSAWQVPMEAESS